MMQTLNMKHKKKENQQIHSTHISGCYVPSAWKLLEGGGCDLALIPVASPSLHTYSY